MRAVSCLAVLGLAALAACESPREACINQGARELRTVEALIRQTQANLQRGYAVETDQEVRVRPRFCRIRDADGTVRQVPCERTEVRDVRRPVAIDPRSEQAKLQNLLERRQRLQAEQAARIQACTARFPE
ncbi:hypothetical protein [Rubellimicrobium sp. CFH 75288]|uniref:hypothetical protein n=1 Tax=Rubellimicrobium sp. CFH 75288 TaxID=2697034 RepID=UPI0014133818|nr:hypothetical protein [Rubellimicrobium sp. CFH 75288]NAZ37921.1 hypothetical protein [Rubellimicrobium sp. CFH 75288]